MASAQSYWGRLAALLLRVLYALFPQVDWNFVFVDDFLWLLRSEGAVNLAVALLATLLALGTPLSRVAMVGDNPSRLTPATADMHVALRWRLRLPLPLAYGVSLQRSSCPPRLSHRAGLGSCLVVAKRPQKLLQRAPDGGIVVPGVTCQQRRGQGPYRVIRPGARA